MTPADEPSEDPPHCVVGIGASAGGVEALEQFFAALPENTAAAYVVIQHLSPGFESHMQELLRRRTAIRVRCAEHGMPVRRNQIYLMPPKVDLRIEQGKLLLSAREPGRSASQPINLFFASLAKDFGKNAIAVVLSGAGSDGTQGIGEVHHAGGLVLVQSVESAKFPTMPSSAIATGLVQLVQPPSEIAKSIAKYAGSGLQPAVFAAQQLAANAEGGGERASPLLRRRGGGVGSAAKNPTTAPALLPPQSRSSVSMPMMPRAKVDHQLLASYDRLLDRYMPASILVSDYEVVHAFGGAEKYLRYRGGRMSSGILDLLDDQLRVAIGVALQHAAQSGQSVGCPELIYRAAEGPLRLAITIQPLPEPQGAIEKFLIVFNDTAGETVPPPRGRQLQLDEVNQRHIESLETELQSTQSRLQAAVAELEALNEALHAANENLLCSNEELQSANEELQSANEELYTVNSENQRRVLELSEASDDLEKLFAHTRVSVIFLDEDLRVRRFTSGMSEVFRLLPQDLGRSIITFTHNLSYPDLIADMQEVLETHQEKEFEVESTEGRTFLLRMLPHLHAGRLSGIVMALVDVEATRRTEQQWMLRDRALNAAASGIIIAEASSEELPIIYVNEGFERLTGFYRKHAIGRSCGFLQGPDTDPQAVAAIRTAISQRRGCRVTLLNYKKNGQPFWNDFEMTPVSDGSGVVTHYVGVQHDITDRYLQHRAIAQSEQDYRDVFENAAVGLACLDAHGHWTRVNNRLCEIVGYNRDELLGMTFHQLTEPEDLGECVSQFDSLISGEIASCRCESRYHHRDGHIVWVLLMMARRVAGDERGPECIAAIEDISARKEAELALQRARRMADSANRAKSNFVANMSHELRTPTTAILGFAQMLEDELENPDQVHKVQTLKRNGEYLLHLLDDILDLSKIESRQSILDTEPCEFMELIGDVEVLMQGRASQVGSELTFHFPTPLPKTIYTSGARVRRVLVNLIANALKFTLHGQVHVTIGYREQDCGGEDALPCIEVEVADGAAQRTDERTDERPDEQADEADEEGVGAFVPFTRADPAIVQRFAGRGSGLIISKRLVIALGGTIEVAHDRQGGNTFRVRLPIGEAGDLEWVTPPSGASEPPAIADANQLRCIEAKILVADDRRDIWQVTKYFLERCGAEVAVAEDGRQAVDAVAAAAKEGDPFELLLLDMQMPVMNGLEAVRALRRAGFTLPIIALTADAMKGERQKCLAAGCDDYLTKPIDVAILTQTVAKHLGEKV